MQVRSEPLDRSLAGLGLVDQTHHLGVEQDRNRIGWSIEMRRSC